MIFADCWEDSFAKKVQDYSVAASVTFGCAGDVS